MGSELLETVVDAIEKHLVMYVGALGQKVAIDAVLG
jgi:hypothetical protein